MGEYFGPELSEPDPGSCYYPALRQGPDQPAKYSKSKAYLQVKVLIGRKRGSFPRTVFNSFFYKLHVL